MNCVLDLLIAEIEQAALELRDIAWVRVTPDALQGSPVSLPVTPERARQIKLQAYEGGGEFVVDVAAELLARLPLELVVHPADWHDLLVAYAWITPNTGSTAYNFMGIPVR